MDDEYVDTDKDFLVVFFRYKHIIKYMYVAIDARVYITRIYAHVDAF